ncbi:MULTISPECIES: histidine--tRNA ligase [Helicobacter]|uniref:Histidine--tRNA ligase n=1 Tax=Helicobacter ibis TaxID=2962633 RepID=A0ABT4VCL7_9HELI|nr:MULTISPECIES: histidine--tRNA ligase [Helicobacter]MDA3966774.1 histidine--tRNA ligase [Helicobacter sp. WB40]MDA3968444.1 histidine--tRNA ligase [Helicobacter ibis]
MPITPRTLSGFKDKLPHEAYAKSKMIKSLIESFESFGFPPIETPHLEYAEILKKQGSDEIQKEMYHFKDHGDREVALRFDLTVPLARFLAQYKNELGLPFKRYCIGNVFRGERAQRGRYREFTQCDFDILGTNSIGADCEIIQVIYASLKNLGLENFTININNRKIFNGLCSYLSLENQVVEILRIIDKIDKIGLDSVKLELSEKLKLNDKDIEFLIDFLNIKQEGCTNGIFTKLEKYKILDSKLQEGIAELEELCNLLENIIPSKNYKINLSIARGLGYYTGIIYETTLDDLQDLGSVCSGGRYDNLISNFSSDNISGVGASIGLDRLLAGLESLQLIKANNPANAIIIPLNNLKYAYKIAKNLRENGLNIEVYGEVVKPKKSLQYANNKNYKWAIILGEEEEKTNTLTLKNMLDGSQNTETIESTLSILNNCGK